MRNFKIQVVSFNAFAFAVTFVCNSFNSVNIALSEPWPFVERPAGPRYYLGDEDARLGYQNFLAGNYGNAEHYFRRAVEVTPQNGAAWLGLAGCYDRLGRFDLSERAYKTAGEFLGDNVAFYNNRGYSYLLRGRKREAAKYFNKAFELAPEDPTVNNNMKMLSAGQNYFWGSAPYIWGWPK